MEIKKKNTKIEIVLLLIWIYYCVFKLNIYTIKYINFIYSFNWIIYY